MGRNVFKSLLGHPLAIEKDLDAPETTLLHSRIIKEKASLKRIYTGWYRSIRSAIPPNNGSLLLELGSGGGFFKEIFPSLLTSDILHIPVVDVVLDGQQLPFKRSALGGVVMVDVFHHLPDVERFLVEAGICVKPGGVIVMIEPWHTRWAGLVYRHLHHEPFIPDAASWSFPEGNPMSQSNSALPWIVFSRDRNVFNKKFPQWRIRDISLHGPFSYLLSGGVSYRNVVPAPIFEWIHRNEDRLRPWMKHLALFARIVLVRNND